MGSDWCMGRATFEVGGAIFAVDRAIFEIEERFPWEAERLSGLGSEIQLRGAISPP